MKNFIIIVLLSLLLMIILLGIDFLVSDVFFCPTCEFNDNNFIFKLFYTNNSTSGYHSEPTFLNIIFVIILSLSISFKIDKKYINYEKPT